MLRFTPPRVARAAGMAWACLALAAACVLAVPRTAAKLVVMHGYPDLTSGTLWIQADAPGPVAVAWRPEGEAADRRVELEATAANDSVVIARLSGMKPGKSASYRVEAGADRYEGTFRAQPYWAKPADAQTVTIAIGSCFYLADPDPLWPGHDYGGGFGIFDAIAAQKPDMMLWLGDNLYMQQPDYFDPSSMAMRYRRQRAFEPLQALLRTSAHIAIWDDHDYGPNDSDASYVLKGDTLRLFRRYWPNPSSGLPDVPGTFGAARYGDILFFLLDDRYYRSPNGWPDGPDKTMFGARQLEWLKQALVSAPRASIKIVASGSQFWNQSSRFEGWHDFATEQQAFADWLMARKIEGLIFLSGDRHFGELLRIERPGAYPLLEFTSSPLTSKPPARIDDAERANPSVVAGTLMLKRQFGMLRVTGPGNDRRIALESRDVEGALLWRHDLQASDLRFPRAR
jgi:alkaline phosphatase D